MEIYDVEPVQKWYEDLMSSMWNEILYKAKLFLTAESKLQKYSQFAGNIFNLDQKFRSQKESFTIDLRETIIEIYSEKVHFVVNPVNKWIFLPQSDFFMS